MVLLFIGPSGSGKDTQAELLEPLNFSRISTGDLLREISEGEHEIQKIIRKSMDEGFLADNFVFGLLETYFKHTNLENIILSGVVRRETQIDLLDFALFKANKKLDKVIFFELSDEEAIRRMSSRYKCPQCGTNYNLLYNPPKQDKICDLDGTELTRRQDDSPEGIKNRLDDFHKYNNDILAQYEKKGILIRIDASKTIQEIHEEIKSKINFTN